MCGIGICREVKHVQEKVQSLPIDQEVALPFGGAVQCFNSPLHPKHLHPVAPNVQLLQTQLALSRITTQENSKNPKQKRTSRKLHERH